MKERKFSLKAGIEKDSVETKLKTKSPETEKFVEGIDYYYENGLMVLTAHFLRKRGYCCKNICRHCPYREDE